jgi:hypothetical protein
VFSCFFFQAALTYGALRLRFLRIVNRSRMPGLEVTPLLGETKNWRELCAQAVVEQDPDRFIATVQELIRVLEDDEERRRRAMGLRARGGENPAKLSWQVA